MKNPHFFIFLLGVSRLALAFGPMSEGMGSRIPIKCRFSFFRNEKSVIHRRNLLLCFSSHHRPPSPAPPSRSGSAAIVLFIRMPKGTHGAYIAKVAHNEEEKEFLLQKRILISDNQG